MGWRDQWLWQRDLSDKPNLWLVHLAMAVVWGGLAVLWLARGRLFLGVCYVVLAVAELGIARYTYRKARVGRPG